MSTSPIATVNPAITFLVQDPLSEEDDQADTSFTAAVDDEDEVDRSASDCDSDCESDADISMSLTSDTSDDDANEDILDELPKPITQRSKLLAQFSSTPGRTIETWGIDPLAPENVEDEAYIAMRSREIEEEHRRRMKGGGEGVGETEVEKLTI